MLVEQLQTVDDLLKAWDANDSIWTLSMGGLGPGYEQAIQIAAVEFARAGKSMPRTEDEKADYKKFGELCDVALKTFDDKIGGITGAMYGAAKWLAWQWCHNGGPADLCKRAKENGQDERLMQVSRQFPKAP